MTTAYLWLKAIHIIGVITWFAGLFYLPRLFVYHTMAHDQESKDRFTMMEEKLYRIIMRPSMIIAVVFGLWIMVLAWDAFASSAWLWLKIVGAVALLGYHHYCGRLIRAFARQEEPHSEKFYRLFNELPAVLLITMVILVVVKPF